MKRNLIFIFVTLLLATACGSDEKEQTFRVTFDSQGGTAVEAQIVPEEGKVTRPADPTREGYTFGGWYKEATCQNAWNFSSDVVESNITLYAYWLAEGTAYVVTFESNGGTRVEPQTVAAGGKATRPLPPTKDGEAFDNWYTETAFTNIYDFGDPVHSNLTLYAKWTSVDMSALIGLVKEARTIPREHYTPESYDAMLARLEQAEALLEDSSATQDEVESAYNALSDAIKNLEEVDYRPTVSIRIENPVPVDGKIFVVPGSSVNIYASGVDKDNNESTYPEVTFTAPGLEDWTVYGAGSGDSGTNFSFQAKDDLTPGQTCILEIRSADVLSVVVTVTLEVIAGDDLKTRFLNAVAALPAPSQITYDHLELLRNAHNLCVNLPWEIRETAEVMQGLEALEDCLDAYWKLPQKIAFTFNGNRATTTFEDIEGSYFIDLTYTSGGSFPVGTWLSDWMWDYDEYRQDRLVLKADKTVVMEYRTSGNAQGTGASDWQSSAEGTYTFEGSQSAGGYLYLDVEYEDDDLPSPEPGEGKGRSLRR